MIVEKTIKSMKKVGFSKREIYTILKKKLVDGLVELKKNRDFAYLMDLDTRFKRVETRDEVDVEVAVCRNLHIKNVIQAVLQGTADSEQVQKLEGFFCAPVLSHQAQLDLNKIYCDKLITNDLEKVEYIDFPLLRFTTTTPVSPEKAKQLCEWVLKSYRERGMAAEYPKLMILQGVRGQLNNLSKEAVLEEAKKLLKKKSSKKGARAQAQFYQLLRLIQELEK